MVWYFNWRSDRLRHVFWWLNGWVAGISSSSAAQSGSLLFTWLQQVTIESWNQKKLGEGNTPTDLEKKCSTGKKTCGQLVISIVLRKLLLKFLKYFFFFLILVLYRSFVDISKYLGYNCASKHKILKGGTSHGAGNPICTPLAWEET